MKKSTIFFVFILLSFLSFSQPPNWTYVRSAGGVNDEEGNSIASDTFGNIYVAGFFESSTFNIGTYTFSNPGTGSGTSTDFFVAKYNSAGSVQWAIAGGGPQYEEATSITTDLAGNIYVTGFFDSPTITIGSFTLTNSNPTGNNSVFIAKINSLGTVLWAKNSVGTLSSSLQVPRGIKTDVSGNVFLTGTFTSNNFIN